MAKVLVADDDRDIRDLLVDTLVECGYEVIEAADGRAAFELACQEEPDLILLDVWMPALDGFEVLGKLRDTPNTRSIPVVLLTALRATSGEGVAMSLGVSHYITKPWEPGTVETAVRVALREAGHSPPVGPAAPFVRTGSTLLDQKLSGGIPLGSLTLVERPPSTGKSALCQHFMYESLLDGRKAAYFASEHTTMSLAGKMSSFGRDVSSYVRAGRLAVYPVNDSPEKEPAGGCWDPERSMAQLALDIGNTASRHTVIVVDSLTGLASHSGENGIMTFFSSCKRMCERGATIIPEARTYAFDDRLLGRLQLLCNSHLNLRAEKIGARMVKMLEIRKVQDAELSTGNVVSFDVAEGLGLRIVPGAKVRL